MHIVPLIGTLSATTQEYALHWVAISTYCASHWHFGSDSQEQWLRILVAINTYRASDWHREVEDVFISCLSLALELPHLSI